MSDLVDDNQRQLEDELDRAVIGPVSAVFGLDMAEQLRDRLPTVARVLAGQLCQDCDDRLAAQTTIDVLGALWPDGVDDDWWRTPVGRMCARSLGTDAASAEAVTYSAAAAMLGVTRGTVSQLVARGTLGRHSDGGVTRASVLTRIGRPPSRAVDRLSRDEIHERGIDM